MIGLSTFLITIFSSQEKTVFFSDNRNQIMGLWEWIESQEFYPPKIYTPETVKYSRRYLFSDAGKFIEYKNSNVIKVGYYEIRDNSPFFMSRDSGMVIILYDDKEKRGFDVSFNKSDTLTLKMRTTDTGY